jgi:hypothetical protein
MSALSAAFLLIFLLPPQAFGASSAEKAAMFAVRLTTESGVLAGCERVGRVRDSSMEDLRKKIIRSGGNSGHITFDSDNLERIHADVYRCAVVPK